MLLLPLPLPLLLPLLAAEPERRFVELPGVKHGGAPSMPLRFAAIIELTSGALLDELILREIALTCVILPPKEAFPTGVSWTCSVHKDPFLQRRRTRNGLGTCLVVIADWNWGVK